MNYFIFLKSKQGDFNAIKDIDDHGVVPFFDFIARSDDSQDIQKKQEKFINSIKKFWSPESRFYVDHYDLTDSSRMPTGGHPYLSYKTLIEDGFDIGLVAGIDRDIEYENALFTLLSTSEDIPVCVRLNLNDIHAPRIIMSEIKDLINDLKNFTSIIDIVVDCRVINMEVDLIAKIIKRFLLEYEKLKLDSLFVVTSSSIPMLINDILKTGNQCYLTRNETNLWKKVKSIQTNYASITYGDYGTVSPNFQEIDSKGRPIPIVPKITYTFDNSYFITRGKLVSQHLRGFKQFKDLSNDVLLLNGFRKASSFGDKYIEMIADNTNSKSGNATTWITATMNQHINYINKLI